jgi:Domain of unknown function (DUF222)/HNH endonuclease
MSTSLVLAAPAVDDDSTLAELFQRLASLGRTDKELVDRVGLLENIKAACAAGQLRATAAFEASQNEHLKKLGVEARDRAHSIAGQLGLARREPPSQARRRVAVAKVLVDDMPVTMAALGGGIISEWHATEIARQTVLLDSEQRRQLDAELGRKLRSLSVGQARKRAKAIAHRLEPETASEMIKTAERERCVTIRQTDDGMTYVTGKLPLIHGVAVFGALHNAAMTAKNSGDPRTKGQLMADGLVSRVTGRDAATLRSARETSPSAPATSTGETGVSGVSATPTPPAGIPTVDDLPAGSDIEIQLIMTERTLLDGDDEPALLSGHDGIPAPLARQLIRDAGPQTRVWVRRLFAHPETGQLVAMDKDRRLFPLTMRRFLLARDQVCRTPWCGAPIRHSDHVQPAANGGPTTSANAQGLCEACNYAKSTPGWSAESKPDGTVVTTTPTGHSYSSYPPTPPRSESWMFDVLHATFEIPDLRRLTASERRIRNLVLAA